MKLYKSDRLYNKVLKITRQTNGTIKHNLAFYKLDYLDSMYTSIITSFQYSYTVITFSGFSIIPTVIIGPNSSYERYILELDHWWFEVNRFTIPKRCNKL